MGAVRRGVRRARLRGRDGQRRAVRPRAGHRHLQLLQDVLDDRLAGRLRGVSRGRSPQLLGTLQEPMLSCISGVSQYAALAALAGPQDGVARKREIYRCRRDLVGALLRDGGFDAVRPAGAFYQMVPLGPGHRQPARRPRPRRARRRHGARDRRSARSPATSCGCRSPHRRRRCAVGSSASSPGLTRRRPGRRSSPRRRDHSSAVRADVDPQELRRPEVLKGVDLVVSPGEHVVVFGPSGSGKSTLLRTINLLERPTSGSVCVFGTEYGPGLPGAAADAGTGDRAAPPGRHGLPAVQPVPPPQRPRQRRHRAAPGEVDGQARRPRAGRHRAAPGRPARPTSPSSPTSCPAASSSASPSPGRWRWTPR